MLCQANKCLQPARHIRWLQGEGSFINICDTHVKVNITTPHKQHAAAVKEAEVRIKNGHRRSNCAGRGISNGICGYKIEGRRGA